jgi:hypothetical protein
LYKPTVQKDPFLSTSDESMNAVRAAAIDRLVEASCRKASLPFSDRLTIDHLRGVDLVLCGNVEPAQCIEILPSNEMSRPLYLLIAALDSRLDISMGSFLLFRTNSFAGYLPCTTSFIHFVRSACSMLLDCRTLSQWCAWLFPYLSDGTCVRVTEQFSPSNNIPTEAATFSPCKTDGTGVQARETRAQLDGILKNDRFDVPRFNPTE